MNCNELFEKHQLLETENYHLKEEFKHLKLQLRIPEQQGILFEFPEQKFLPQVGVQDHSGTMGSSGINNFFP